MGEDTRAPPTGCSLSHLNAVPLHADEEAAAQLGPRGASIEQGGGRVGEPSLAEQVIGLEHALQEGTGACDDSSTLRTHKQWHKRRQREGGHILTMLCSTRDLKGQPWTRSAKLRSAKW